jgi:hypothetical protein
MAKEKLEDLSIEQLRKRRKTVSIFLGIYAGIIAITLIIVVFGILMDGKRFNSIAASLVPGIVLIFFLILMFNGRKKIDEELAKRNDK